MATYKFRDNHVRGCGYYFGRVAAFRFVDRNEYRYITHTHTLHYNFFHMHNLISPLLSPQSSIVRGHEVQQWGYTEHRFGDFERSSSLNTHNLTNTQSLTHNARPLTHIRMTQTFPPGHQPLFSAELLRNISELRWMDESASPFIIFA